MKKILLGVALFFLIVLLFLPPCLRWFGKDLYAKKEEVNKNVVKVLNCTKNDETINTTYFNEKPYNFRYSIIGNYLSDEEDEEKVENQIISDVKNVTMSSYDEATNATIYTVVLSTVEMQNEKMKNYIKEIEDQQNYYQSIGFMCTISQV